MDLITTRTQGHVTRLKTLRAKVAAGTATESERLEYLYGYTEAAESQDGYLLADSTGEALELYSGEQLGAYNAIDVNRVETAVETIQEAMNEAPEDLRALAETLGVAWDSLFDVPYDPLTLTVKTDWAEADFPTASEMDRYLTNMRRVVTAAGLAAEVLPESMSGLDYQGANRIEEMLVRSQTSLETLIRVREAWIANTAAGAVHSGMANSGVLWNQIGGNAS